MTRMVLFFFISVLLFLPLTAESQVIGDMQVQLKDNDISVSFSVHMDQDKVHEIEKGIEKELRLYVDLFRVWKMWPDEFVGGKRFMRMVSVNPIKKEYIASSNDGSVIIERRFRSISSMLDWVLTVKDLRLSNLKELEPGLYYVKITVESRIRKLPPVIGGILLFVSENEFSISRKSELFRVGTEK